MREVQLVPLILSVLCQSSRVYINLFHTEAEVGMSECMKGILHLFGIVYTVMPKPPMFVV